VVSLKLPAKQFKPFNSSRTARKQEYADERWPSLIFCPTGFLTTDRPILQSHLRSQVLTRSTIMGKIRQGNKEAKKQAALTPKEKEGRQTGRKACGWCRTIGSTLSL
jgi:hypothetical protein